MPTLGNTRTDCEKMRMKLGKLENAKQGNDFLPQGNGDKMCGLA
jgi:hypothetical protein